MSQEFEPQIIRSSEDLRLLIPAWLDLLDHCPGHYPFQTPSWLIPWTQRLMGGDLSTIAIHRSRTLVALLPCFRHQWQQRRQLTLLGTGLSDQLGLLIRSDALASLPLILETVTQLPADVVHFQDLAVNDPLATSIPSHRCEQCLQLPLPTTYKALLSRLGSGLRRNLQRYGQRFAERGFTLHRTMLWSPDLLQLLHLHAARQPHSLLIQPAAQMFFTEAVQNLAAASQLRVVLAFDRDQLIGGTIAFAAGPKWCGYLTAFQQEYASLSPGTLILGEMLTWAIEERASDFDFLRGTETYKLHWGAQPYETLQIILNQKEKGGRSLPDHISIPA